MPWVKNSLNQARIVYSAVKSIARMTVEITLLYICSDDQYSEVHPIPTLVVSNRGWPLMCSVHCYRAVTTGLKW